MNIMIKKKYFANTVEQKGFFYEYNSNRLWSMGIFYCLVSGQNRTYSHFIWKKELLPYTAVYRNKKQCLLTLPESIQLTSDLDAVDEADVIVISIAAQSLDSLMTQLQTMKLQN